MTTFESTIKQVQASQKAVYAKLSDLNNLAKVKDRLPEHKVKNMTFDTDTLSMQAPPIGTITLKIVAREPESCITFGTTSSPLPFDLQIHISPVSETESQLQLPQDRVSQARELHGVRGVPQEQQRQDPVLPQVYDKNPGHLRVRGTSPSLEITIRLRCFRSIVDYIEIGH